MRRPEVARAAHAVAALALPVLALATLASPARGESSLGDRPCPDAEAVAAGRARPCGDGYFTRFSASARLLRAHVRAIELGGNERYEQRLDVTSPVISGDVALGGTPLPGLLVGGFFGYDYAEDFLLRGTEQGSAEPDFTWRYRVRGVELRNFRLGVAVAIFPNPLRGLVIDVRPCLSLFSMVLPDYEYLDYETLGGELGVGYEIWVGRNMGLGLGLRTALAKMSADFASGSDPGGASGWLSTTGLAVNWTLH